MNLELRHEPEPPANDILVVHMGAGDHHRIVEAVVNSHDLWLPIAGRGKFAFSVYAASGDEGVETIIGSFRHGQFGTATVGEIVAAGFGLVATNTLDVADDVLAALQPCHYSVVVRDGLETSVLEADVVTINALIEELTEPLAMAFELFAPRQANTKKRRT